MGVILIPVEFISLKSCRYQALFFIKAYGITGNPYFIGQLANLRIFLKITKKIGMKRIPMLLLSATLTLAEW